MKQNFTKLLFVFITLILSTNLLAADYKKEARLIRESVWNWDMDVFKNYSVPEKYKNESAVVLARHQQIEATSKNRFRMNALLFGDVNRELFYTNVDRIMIKLNDQKALDEYSELSFKEEVKTRGYLSSNKLITVLGARIIKPNGTIEEVNVDEDAVTITEGKKDKDAYKKIAIKGLEVGDILDYFYSEEMKLETVNIEPQAFYFFYKYPILSYSIECVFGDKLTVEYRSVNGAPTFEESIDNDNNIVLKASGKDFPVFEDLKDARWFSTYRSFPLIRLYILNNSSKLVYKSTNARKSGVYKDVAYEEILKDKQGEMARWESQLLWEKEIFKDTQNAITNYKQKTSDITNDDLALYIYDALRFYWPSNSRDYPELKFLVALEKILKENNIECKMCFTTSRYGAKRDEVVEDGDLVAFVSTNDNKQLFFYPNGYKSAGEVPWVYDGETASAIAVRKYKKNSKIAIEGIASEFKIPVSSIDDNRKNVKIDVFFSDDNPLDLKIKRITESFGEMKEDYQMALLLYEDWDKAMRKRLLIETDFWMDMSKNKDSRKYIEEYKTYFEDKRKAQKELFESEFKEYHSINSGTLTSFAVNQLGATIEHPAFEFEAEYTIDGLVKKAGNNLILDAGKLIGTQWVPTEKGRIRNFDTYISTPLIIKNDILVHIPEQYTVEALEALSRNIDNEFGNFTSKAVLIGSDLLKIETTKVYKKNFVPTKDWNILLEMIDKTNEFYSQSIMLKLK